MATIVFAILPELGHLNASLKLAKSLKSRGHQVYYLVAAEYREYISFQGLETIELGTDETAVEDGLGSASETSQLPLMELLLNSWIQEQPLDTTLRKVMAVLEAAVQSVARKLRPALFIIDLFVPDVVAIARGTGVPYVLLNSTLFDPLKGVDRFNKIRTASGAPELVLCPKEFDFPHAVTPQAHRYHIEASIDLERKDIPFPWERISAGKPLIYCSLGSQPFRGRQEVFQPIIDAMKDRKDWQMVFTTGNAQHDQEAALVPSNVVLVKRAPQLEVLQRASLMITHGGLNGIKEAIYFGVPMILMPLEGGKGSDQPMNAARAVYHGLGIRADSRQLSAENIGSLFNRIQRNQSFRDRTSLMKRKFRELEAAGLGVKIIEALLMSIARRYPATSRETLR